MPASGDARRVISRIEGAHRPEGARALGHGWSEAQPVGMSRHPVISAPQGRGSACSSDEIALVILHAVSLQQRPQFVHESLTPMMRRLTTNVPLHRLEL